MRLFAYGTLKDLEVVRCVIGDDNRELTLTPAVLKNYGMLEAGYKFITPCHDKEVRGMMIDGLTQNDIPCFDRYECVKDGMYERRLAVVWVGSVSHNVFIYVAGPTAPFWEN